MNIRQQRQALGLTVRDVAAHAGMNSVSVAKIERGERRPKPRSALNIGEILGMDPALLAGLPPWDQATPRQRLRILRYRRGWSIRQVADRAGVDRSTVSAYETHRIPNDPTFVNFVGVTQLGFVGRKRER